MGSGTSTRSWPSPGVDSVTVGALDLSGSMGLLGKTDDPSVEDAVQRVLAAAKAAGKPCGIVALGPTRRDRRISEEFTSIIVAIDVLMLLDVQDDAGQDHP